LREADISDIIFSISQTYIEKGLFMEKHTVYITKYTLSPLFEKTLKLLKPTWKASLVSNLILFIPLSIVYIFYMQNLLRIYFDFLPNILNTTSSGETIDNMTMLTGQMLPLMGFSLVYSLISGIIGTFAFGVVSRNAFSCASGETPHWKGLMLETLGSLVVFYILQTLIMIGLSMVVAVPIGILIGLVSLSKAAVAAVLLIMLLYLVLIVALLCLSNILQFGPSIIANEDISGSRAIVKCFALAKGEFFRILGISTLFSLAFSFALSLILTPFMFIAFIPFYTKLFQSVSNGAESDPSAMFRMMRDSFLSSGPLFGIIFAINYIASYTISPLFTTLFYIDLRVRKGEIADAAQFADLSGQGQA
jgi:hypothetical protein